MKLNLILSAALVAGVISATAATPAPVSPAPSAAVTNASPEAAMKALGVGLGAFDFHDVSIRRADSGEPQMVVTGRAALLAADKGVGGWRVSLSHTETVAIAVVAAL